MSRMRIQSTELSFTGMLCMAFVLLALMLSGCSADSPTEPPTQTPPPPASGGGGGTSAWNITVSAEPDRVEINGTDVSSSVTVTARRADNGQPPPTGSTMILTTSLGTLTAGGASGSQVILTLNGGVGIAGLVVPGIAETTVVIQGQLEQSVGQGSLVLAMPAPPPTFIVESVSPSTGPPGGRRVTIRGSGFDEPVRVFFGGVRGDVISVSGSRIVANAPPREVAENSMELVDVSVTINVNEAGTASDTLSGGFTYVGEQVLVPQLISITPTSGPNEGGTNVTIFGDEFSNQVQVFFGTATTRIEAQVQSVSRTRIQAITPSATGVNSGNINSLVDVRVVNLDSGITADLVSAFQYGNPSGNIAITAISPGEGPYFGGTTVTHFGRGFDEPIALEYGTVAQSPISVTGTEVVSISTRINPPTCDDIEGASLIVNIETGESATGPPYVYRVLSPQIFNITPSTSVQGGGGAVTVNGSNIFASEPYRVTFGLPNGPAAGQIISVVDGAVTVQAPAFAGEFDQVDCGDGGMMNVDTSVSVTLTNLATSCFDVFANSFTYFPDDRSCQGQAPPPPPPPATGPTAAITVSQAAGSLTVNFSSAASVAGDTPINTWSWDFGDGTSSTTANPVKTYLAPGTYTAVLTVTDAGGLSDNATATVTVPAP